MKPASIRSSPISGDLQSGVPTLLDLRYGWTQAWSLVAEFAHGGELVTVTFDRPTAFRVTDEGNLIWYWSASTAQGEPRSFVYELEGTAWLAEYASSAAAPHDAIKHYLFAGSDDCLEVLCWGAPALTRAPAGRAA